MQIRGIDGKKMQELRLNSGFTRKKLAEITGVHVSTITRLENGNSEFILEDTLLRFANALGIKPMEYLKAIRKES